MYKIIVGHCGIQPSEFWSMSPQECWMIIAARKPPEKVGKMDKSTFEQLKKALKNG